jgi:hypothetical protein
MRTELREAATLFRGSAPLRASSLRLAAHLSAPLRNATQCNKAI